MTLWKGKFPKINTTALYNSVDKDNNGYIIFKKINILLRMAQLLVGC
jgi:hypothetical protein